MGQIKVSSRSASKPYYFLFAFYLHLGIFGSSAMASAQKTISFDDPVLTPGSKAKSAEVGKVFQVSVSDLLPLECCYGPREVQSRIRKYNDKNPRKKKAYLTDKTVDVTIGPNGKIYLVDGHHLARMALELKQPTVLAKVDSVYWKGSMEEFFKHLENEQKVYLYNGEKKISYNELPKNLEFMSADPYRDVFWELQESGDVNDVEINFIEFEWARLLFRKHISASTLTGSYAKAIEQARVLSHGDEAKALFAGKGFRPEKK